MALCSRCDGAGLVNGPGTLLEKLCDCEGGAMKNESLQLLTVDGAAEAIGVSTVTLWRWRTADPPKGPRFIVHGGRVKYTREDIDKWMREGDPR